MSIHVSCKMAIVQNQMAIGCVSIQYTSTIEDT